MTKLTIVIHSLRGGGAERVLINLLKGLGREDFSVQLVLYEEVFDYPVPPSVEVVSLDIKASRNFFRMTTRFVSKILALSRVFQERKPDIIFSFLSSTNVTVILAKLLSRMKSTVIISEHTYPTVNLKNEIYGGITKYFMKLCYPHADRIVAVCGAIKQDLVRGFGIADEKVKVIYNPVDIKEIVALAGEQVDHPWFCGPVPVITSVGRLTKQKGYPFLLRAFAQVRKDMPCRLAIIGEGEDRTKLNDLVRELKLQEDVLFMGFQKNPFKFMAKSLCFVLPSLYEGFPNVLLEAMALGIPVVSTDCPSGPSEVLSNGKNGLLVTPADEIALSEAMRTMLRSPDFRMAVASEARVSVQNFSLETIAKDYRSLFLENSSSSL